jgi:hypothetical protein
MASENVGNQKTEASLTLPWRSGQAWLQLHPRPRAVDGSRGLIGAGDPALLTARYTTTLWGDLLIRLLMRVHEAPTEREIVARGRAATEMLVPLR